MLKEREKQSMEMSTTPTNETTIIVDDKMLLMDN